MKKRMIWSKFKTGFFFILTAVLCILIYLPQSSAEEERTIRVGFHRNDGYHTVDSLGNHSGYDYEYLIELAKYTGWKYEFVEGSWEECLSRMENGEIDLLGSVEKDERNLSNMSFSNIPSAFTVNCLLAEQKGNRYAYEDFAAFNGMRIGTLRGASSNDALDNYAKENHFIYTKKQYDTEKELDQALENEEIDCISLNDFRNLDHFEVIGRFGYTPCYYAVRKDAPELLDELNSAIKQLHLVDPNYEGKLSAKYFSPAKQVALSREEEAFIRENSKIPVLLFDGFPLICEHNELTNEYSGIIMDVLDALSDKTGLNFVYETMPTDVIPWEYLDEYPNAILAPLLRNSLIQYYDEMQMLTMIVPGRMAVVSKAGTKVDLNEKFTLAIPEGMYGAEANIQKMFPKAELVYCSSHKDGLDMVCSMEADITLINEITAAYWLQSFYYKDLKVIDSDRIMEDITMALGSTSDPLLVSILNKGIASFDERDIRQIVMDNTVSRPYQYSPKEWLSKNRLLVFLTCVILAGGTAILWYYRRQKQHEAENRRQMELAEERHRADINYRKKILHQANFDKLTDLYSKEYFEEKANELMRRNPHIVYAFFRINIEKFKMINEMYGTDCGDLILLQVADLLKSRLGEDGIYGRLYADQFAVCYPTDEETLRSNPQKTLMYFNCAGQMVRVQLNIGVCVNYRQYQDAQQILDYAQMALQYGENAGNKHFYYYRESYLIRLFRNQKITNEMEMALQTGQFHVFLQPQVDHINRKLVGAEALVRWFHPTEGMISPADFIPVFEKNQFIYRLDLYVCEQVCALLAKWEKSGIMIPISVNISRTDLLVPELCEDLIEIVQRYRVNVRSLHLEITESASADENVELFETLTKLRENGFLLEMDDFGSGYSSLNMLKDLPVDLLKLDMKFFDNETHMEKGGNIIAAIVKLAHSLGLPVIAEGVENEREANFLKTVNCRIVQGYLYGRPLPVPEFENYMKEHEIGEKLFVPDAESDDDDLYWGLEKYYILLCSNGGILFDYSHDRDLALYTAVEKDGGLNEQAIAHYSDRIMEDMRIHPDYREKVETLLESKKSQIVQMEFPADYSKSGIYEWHHAEVHVYCKDAKCNRIIAVIRKNLSEVILTFRSALVRIQVL